MERAADESPYESELWRRFVEIVSEQNKQGRANLVIDHLVGAPDLLDHIQLSDRPIFLCMAMDSEISNGGISQWFGNYTGRHWEETIAQLNQLGAHEIAAVLQKGAELFPDGLPNKDQELRQSQLSAMTNADYDRFEELDDEYWPLRKDLYERLHECVSNPQKADR